MPLSGLCAQTGSVTSAEDLQALLLSAQEGDVILVSGEIDCSSAQPLTSPVSVRIAAEDHSPAILLGVCLQDASISFSGVHLADSLTITGNSHVHLSPDVCITSADGRNALSFTGSGTLIVDRGCSISAGESGSGVSISHAGGEFYASLEGSISGGSGHTGGAGVIVSPLLSGGVMLISGDVRGGDGETVGGHALNLHSLSGNAYVTIDGQIEGGSGMIGGDGMQLVSSVDNVIVGISGQISGGSGESYGGDAVMLMNAGGASIIHLSGEFTGGNSTGTDSQPGTALVTVGDMTSLRARVDNCLLEDGRRTAIASKRIQPQITPLPSIVSDSDDIEEISPL